MHKLNCNSGNMHFCKCMVPGWCTVASKTPTHGEPHYIIQAIAPVINTCMYTSHIHTSFQTPLTQSLHYLSVLKLNWLTWYQSLNFLIRCSSGAQMICCEHFQNWITTTIASEQYTHTYTVEPLFSGDHWESTFCPLQRGVANSGASSRRGIHSWAVEHNVAAFSELSFAVRW